MKQSVSILLATNQYLIGLFAILKFIEIFSMPFNHIDELDTAYDDVYRFLLS